MSTEKKAPGPTDKGKGGGSKDEIPDPGGKPGYGDVAPLRESPTLPGKEPFDPWKRKKDDDL